MAYNPTFVILSSLKSLFFNSLKNELRFSDNAGATPAAPEHEASHWPALEAAGSRPAPQGMDRTGGLETGSLRCQGETGANAC